MTVARDERVDIVVCGRAHEAFVRYRDLADLLGRRAACRQGCRVSVQYRAKLVDLLHTGGGDLGNEHAAVWKVIDQALNGEALHRLPNWRTPDVQLLHQRLFNQQRSRRKLESRDLFDEERIGRLGERTLLGVRG